MRSEQIKLYDIAGCNLYNKNVNSKFKIPNIQRGLVWKSMQMELLWDSILRGFPIGSMLVLDKEGNGGGDILDGQQRANAIITGFNKNEIFGDEKPSNILWLDLNYNGSESDKERREYGIRLTNASHPWGYDENGNKLSANDRRDSLRKALGKDYSQRRKSDWDIRRFVPQFFSKQKDFLPIPLAILVSAAKDKSSASIEEFKKIVASDVKEFSNYSNQWKELYEHDVLNFINNQANEEFLRPFFELNNYCVVFNFVDNNDDIEILFNRVNSRGSQMTNAELAYAAIKHYGAKLCNCLEIGQIIKEKSKGIMLEQNLAQLLFRYCFSNNNKISGEINASKVREKALLDESEKDCDIVIINLRKMFSGDFRTLDNIIKRTKEILLKSPKSPDDCELPNFLLAEIATKNPNLFILLFCLIDKQSHLEDQFVQALIFYLYCFSVNNEPVRLIFEKVSECDNIKEETIIDILRDSISREWCYPIISSFEDFPALNEAELSDSWNIDKYSDAEGFSVFKLLFTYGTYQGLFMLKFAQRRFYKEVFGDYNPSNKEHWDEINRPWDHDHIIPQNWISNGIWKNCQSAWINSIGNIADIPYEENRSKSDEANFDYYTYITDYYGDMLYFDNELQKINRQSFEQGSGSVQFLRITKERFVKITREFLSMFDILHISEGLSRMQLARTVYLTYLKDNVLKNYRFYYRGCNGKEILAKELDFNFWQKPWISLIKECGDKWCHAISIYGMREHGVSSFILERGKRNLSMDSASDIWWKEGTYFGRELPLFNGNDINLADINPAAIIFVDGAHYYNNEKKILGFETDSSSFISFIITFEDVEIKAIIYTYYSSCYCSIRSVNDRIKLPSKVLSYFNEEKGFKWRNNDVSIDCLLLRRDEGIKKNCDAFSEKMVELYNLKKNQEE